MARIRSRGNGTCAAVVSRMSKILFAVVACASCASTPKPVVEGDATPTPHTVLVEAMIALVPPAQVGALAGKDAKQIAALPGVQVMTQPSMILIDHEESSASIGCTPPSQCDSYKLAITSEIRPHDTVHLDIAVSGEVTAQTSETMRSAQSIVFETTRPHTKDGRMFVVVRSTILHDTGELRRLRAVTD
jgi:hypothetical protein